MKTPALLAERHTDHQNAILRLVQIIIAAIGLRLEEGALHLRMETRIVQQRIDDVREARHTGAGTEVATEEDQGPQRGHIRLEEIHVPDHPSPELVATPDLLSLERDRHFLPRENHRHTTDRGRLLNEKESLHQPGRDTRDVSSLHLGIHD